MLLQRDKKIPLQGGFTLIEFVVVMIIFAIMSSVSLFNYNAYRNRIEYTNLAQDIALTIRQAQVYGLSGTDRRIGSDVINPNVLFGSMIVDITQDRSIRGVAINPEQKTLILFDDANRNRIFDETSDVVIDRRAVTDSATKLSVCFSMVLNDNGECEEELSSDNYAYITFTRPYPEPSIRYDGVNYSQFVLIIKDKNNNPKMKVEVTPSGQIAAKKI